MNDNNAPSSLEQMKLAVLRLGASAEAQLTSGLDTLLTRSDAPQQLKDVITQYAEAAVTLVKEMESAVAMYSNKRGMIDMVDKAVKETQAATLGSFSDLFTQLAETPQMMKVASNFRDYVTHVVKEPEKPKEPEKDRGR